VKRSDIIGNMPTFIKGQFHANAKRLFPATEIAAGTKEKAGIPLYRVLPRGSCFLSYL